MDGIMNKNNLAVLKEYEYHKPLIHKIDSIIDNCIRDCHNKYCHTFDVICVYDINFKNIGNNERINIPVSDKSMGLYELKKSENSSTKKFYN